MTSAILGRLVWKEYRVLRTFWLAMAGLAVFLQLTFVLSPAGPETIPWIYACALAAPALYALACGATMFAAEQEDGTYEFLRGLPLAARQVLIGKLTFAVASTSLLLALLWSVANRLTHGSLPDAQTHLNLWGLWGMAAVELLAWGMFFSLVLERPLQAAILGVAATSVGIHLVVWSIAPPGYHWNELGAYLTAVPYRAVIATVVLFVDARLATRWFQAPSVARHQLLPLQSLFPLRRRRSAAADVAGVARPDRSAVIARLAWQTWRESAWLFLTLATVGAAAALLFPFETVFQSDERPRIAVIAIVASLMGSCVFLADQEGWSFRFFAEQGVRPRSVWLVRQGFWITAFLIWTVVVHGCWFIFGSDGWYLSVVYSRAIDLRNEHSLWELGARLFDLPPYAPSLCLSGLAFAMGQLTSMFLRSGIMAGFIGLVITGALCGWALLMYMLEINWLWSVVPLPLAFFCATWLRSSDWILEHNHWRAWLRVAFVLLVPTITLLIAVPLYRVHQIPLASPGFSPEEFVRPITPDQEQTADMYRRAGELLVLTKLKTENKHQRPPNAEELEFLHENEESLALVLAASKRADCSFFDLRRGDFFRPPNANLLALLDVSARERESAGQLDEAWDRYLAGLHFARHWRINAPSYDYINAGYAETQLYWALPKWAAQPGQAPQRIAAAIKQIAEIATTVPPPSDAIKARHVMWMRQINAGDLESLVDAEERHNREARVAMKNAFWIQMPWERSRVLRLLNLGTANDLQRYDFIDNLQKEGRPLAGIIRFQGDDFAIDGIDLSRIASRWWRTTFLLDQFKRTGGLWIARNSVGVETHRRAARLLLALEAWKAEHGELPETLTQLVGQYLDEVPLDPYSGRPFHYFREGVSLPEQLRRERIALGSEIRELPRTAFIWSGGERVYFPDLVANPMLVDVIGADRATGDLPSDFYGVTIYNSWNSSRQPASEYELLLTGDWFEIP